VAVEVLGSEVVDVEHAHHGPDVGIPVGRGGHGETERRFGFGVEAAEQGVDGVWPSSAAMARVLRSWPPTQAPT
jgi:hypothetical protein